MYKFTHTGYSKCCITLLCALFVVSMTSSITNNSPLTGPDDMQNVLDEIEDISDIEGLALALGVRMPSIQSITAASSPASQKRLIIYYWLTRRDIIPEKQEQVPNWSLLAEAVEKQNPALGKKILLKHCNNP